MRFNDFEPFRPEDIFSNKPTQGAGGLPWPRSKPSPTYPTTTGTPTEPPVDAPTEPPNDWQGPLVGGASGAAGGFLGLSLKDWITLIAALTSTYGATKIPKQQPLMPTTTTTDPQLQALLKTQQDRLDYSNPLYQAMISMSMGLLPTNYQMPMPSRFGNPTGPTAPTAPTAPTGPSGPTVPPIDEGPILPMSRERDRP